MTLPVLLTCCLILCVVTRRGTIAENKIVLDEKLWEGEIVKVREGKGCELVKSQESGKLEL